MKYYFLGSLLPELHVGAPPDLGFYELLNLLKDNLDKDDYKKVRVIRWFYDLQNMRALWKGEELDKWGNLNQNELEEALLNQDDFAGLPYVDEFLSRYEKTEDRLYYFPSLLSGYYNDEIPKAEGFLFHFLNFEREWRLVLTAFRAKKMGRDIFKELQYENPDDPIVAQILAQKDAAHYEPPAEYSNLKPLFEEFYNEPFELYQALCYYRFEKISEMIGLDRFSLDAVLAFVAKYIIADKWLELDKKKGIEIVDAIIEENS